MTSSVFHGRVLVIDDEPDIVYLLISILTHAQFIAEGITEPRQMKAMVESFHPDLVITDVAMPEMNGIDVLRFMIQNYPQIPVMFVSGHMSQQILRDAIAHGASSIIEKPFDNQKVIEACHAALRKT